MCGIVGYIGKRDAYPVLIKGLKRLEYRGYDSAGVALIDKKRRLNVYKTKGKVSDLEAFVSQKDVSGTIGIAHTRWATHGEPCQANAHPHFSSSKNLALIHNGIIENYATLKEKLQKKGFIFKSSTDTEVLVQLIEFFQLSNHLDLLTAVQLALHEVIGAYAIAVLDKNNPDEIIAARKSSPLVVGIGKDEFFLASDATPIVEYTDKVVYLQDGEIAVIRRDKALEVVNLDNVLQNPEVRTVEMNLGQLEKGGYPHFMLKEIFEQPDCINDCMRGRINADGDKVVLSAVIDHKERLLKARRFVIVACGTSWHAGLIGKQLIESFCRIPVEVEYASEFRYRDPVIHEDDVVIAISQSGETADTLAAIELAKEKGAFIYGICNAVGSSIPRITDTVNTSILPSPLLFIPPSKLPLPLSPYSYPLSSSPFLLSSFSTLPITFPIISTSPIPLSISYHHPLFHTSKPNPPNHQIFFYLIIQISFYPNPLTPTTLLIYTLISSPFPHSYQSSPIHNIITHTPPSHTSPHLSKPNLSTLLFTFPPTNSIIYPLSQPPYHLPTYSVLINPNLIPLPPYSIHSPNHYPLTQP